MLGWHPQSTCFPASDTSNYFLDFWHYCSFYSFPEHCRYSISKRTQPFYAIQMPCHKEKWRRKCQKHTDCPPAKHRKIQNKFFHWPKWVCNYHHTNALYIMGNHCSDQSQHQFLPHFYSNAFPLLSQILHLSFHTTAWHTNNLNTSNFCR